MNSSLASLFIAIGFVVVSGCKGETVYKDKQQTIDRLALTEAALTEKTDLLNTLNARVATLEKEAGTVIISMEAPREGGEPGAIIEIRGRGPSGRVSSGDPVGNAKDLELYDAFIAKVKASAGSVKKCYEAALKKRSDLATKTVTLAMTVDYRTSGKVSTASFQPQVTPEFDACMKTVAGRWALPAMPRETRFTYRQKLTPQ